MRFSTKANTCPVLVKLPPSTHACLPLLDWWGTCSHCCSATKKQLLECQQLLERIIVQTNIGDNVLRITAKLTRIAPSAPKDDYRSRPVGRSKVVTEGAGDLSVAVTFSDSETGEVLALAKDTRSGSSQWGINNSVTNSAEVRRVFNSWALQIAAQLERIHKKSSTE